MKSSSITSAGHSSKPHVRRSFIVCQNTCLFNVNLLETNGWVARKHENHIYYWTEYEKTWTIQDLEGSSYKIEISLREYENVAFLYVNGAWVGRCLYLSEAEKVVNAIKMGCR